MVGGSFNSGSFMPRMRQRDLQTHQSQDWWIPSALPDRAEAPNRDMSITVGIPWGRAVRNRIPVLRSHQRAETAINAGHFSGEILLVIIHDAEGNATEFKLDEHVRRNITMDKPAPVQIPHPEIEGFSITAGNSSGVNDAAAAQVLTSDEIARAEKTGAVARILGWTAIGVEPAKTGLSLPSVVEKLLARSGARLKHIRL